MKEVLQNLALIGLTNFCRENSIDCSGSHVVKNGRGFAWSLVRDEDRKALATVVFSKNSVPRYYAIR